jgi:DNA-binding MarR family transcriptional regulator
MTVIKTRGRKHSSELRAYEVTNKGIVIGEVLKQYRGLISAIPELRESAQPLAYQGLSDQETMIYQKVSQSGDIAFEDLLSETKLKRAELKRALDRLLALGFVEKTKKKGEIVYREVNEKY